MLGHQAISTCKNPHGVQPTNRCSLNQVRCNFSTGCQPPKEQPEPLRCPITFLEEDVPLVGAPCVLFSQYGLGEGFSNEQKSRVQKASVKFQQRAYDMVDTSEFTEASLRKMAGNGMSLPEGGFMLLMMLLCISNN
ncbi:unnamed protein product [Durusdinium trenchii]|uniref:Uncharacterized protein n=1 Tax=Durusdinium trenchii TaxID=1381693 RepID=A0ABP0QHI7_9DINO